MTIENGRIESTFLGIEDHGILTFMIRIGFDGTSHGFGGYALDGGGPTNGFAAVSIRRLLEAIGVDSWEKLAGSFIRARRDDRGQIESVGHIVNERWVCLRDIAREFQP